MEFSRYCPALPDTQEDLVTRFQEEQDAGKPQTKKKRKN